MTRPDEAVQHSVRIEDGVYAREIYRRHEDLQDRVNEPPRLKRHEVHEVGA